VINPDKASRTFTCRNRESLPDLPANRQVDKLKRFFGITVSLLTLNYKVLSVVKTFGQAQAKKRVMERRHRARKVLKVKA
jgi:hypothetical protein